MKTAEDILREKSKPMVYVREDTVIKEVISRMVEDKIGAMLIKKEDRFVGIWTERDFLCKSLDPGFDLRTSTVSDYMDTNIVSAPAETGIEKLQELFLGLFTRHILILREQTPIGLLSMGDVLRVMLLEKDKEIKELDQIANWEYYENWGWHHQYQKKGNSSKK